MHGSESGAAFLAGWGASSGDLKGSGAAFLPHALAPWVKIELVKICQPSASRWALWAFAIALLLKAAMPLLATASAELQGKTLVEVCTVYGVSLVPLATSGQEQPAPEPMAQHGGEHCVLTALAALAAPELPVLAVAEAPRREAVAPRAPPSSQAPDVCATWVARLKHGPPLLS